jgi:hypothetical protein
MLNAGSVNPIDQLDEQWQDAFAIAPLQKDIRVHSDTANTSL